MTPPDKLPDRQALGGWLRFLRADSHVLARHPRLFIQQAANQPDASAPAAAAALRLSSAEGSRPWIRWLNKPQAVEPLLMTLTGHKDAVAACAVSPDGTRLVSVSKCGNLRIWEAESGVEVASLESLVRDPFWCGFSPDGSRVGLCGSNQARVFDAVTLCDVIGRDEERTLRAAAWTPSGFCVVLQSSESGLAVLECRTVENGSASGRVCPGEMASCALSPDGNRIVTWRRVRAGPRYSNITGCLIQLWDAASGAELARRESAAPALPDCVFSPDGSTILSLWSHRAVRFSSAETGEEVVKIDVLNPPETRPSSIPSWLVDNLRTASETDLARASDWYAEITNQHLFVGGYNNAVRLLSAKDLRECAVLRHSEEVKRCASSTDAGRIVALLDSGDMAVWDASRGERTALLQSPYGRPGVLAFSPDGGLIWSGSDDGAVRLWDASAKGGAPSAAHKGAIETISFSEDGTRVLTAAADRNVRLWESRGGSPVAVVSHSRAVTACAVSRDGRRVVSWSSRVGEADGEGEFLVVEGKHWDAMTGQALDMEGARYVHESEVHTCGIIEDGRRHCSMDLDRNWALWDGARLESESLPEGLELTWPRQLEVPKLWTPYTEPPGATPAPPAGCRPRAVSPDARLLLCERGGAFGIRFAERGEPVVKFEDIRDAASVSRSDRGIICSSDYGGSLLCEALQDPLRVSARHLDARVRWCAYSPDGRYVLVTCDDATLRILNSGTLHVASLYVITGSYVLAAAPDSAGVAIGGGSGRLFLLELEDPG